VPSGSRPASPSVGIESGGRCAAAADTGSSFRIDSCLYTYNLSSSSLGAATYRVDIKIAGQAVGSALFQLK